MGTAARRLAGAAVALALLGGAAAAPADAVAAYSTRVCAAQTIVRTSPGGFTVGYLYRRDRVRVSRRSANRRWAHVTTPTDLRGWVAARALCR